MTTDFKTPIASSLLFALVASIAAASTACAVSTSDDAEASSSQDAALRVIGGGGPSGCDALPMPGGVIVPCDIPRTLSPVFTDAAGWHGAQYAHTVHYGDVDGDGIVDAVGRGSLGVYWSRGDGRGGFGPEALASSFFTDAHGWDAPQFYETIQLADVNGDGLADLVGRAVAGIYVQLAHGGGHFAPPTLATSALSDLAGWANPAYYRTIRFADVNGDGRADLVARSSRGVLVGLSTGTTFTSPVLVAPAFSDSAGWMTYGASLRVADIDGDGMADLVARGAAGVYVARALGGGAFGPATLVSTLFADASGWGLPAYSTSLRVADVDGDGIMDLVARGSMGVRVHFGLRAGVFGAASRVTTAFSDARGWGDSAYRASFDAIDVDGDGRAELVARSSNGLLVVSP